MFKLLSDLFQFLGRLLFTRRFETTSGTAFHRGFFSFFVPNFFRNFRFRSAFLLLLGLVLGHFAQGPFGA